MNWNQKQRAIWWWSSIIFLMWKASLQLLGVWVHESDSCGCVSTGNGKASTGTCGITLEIFST